MDGIKIKRPVPTPRTIKPIPKAADFEFKVPFPPAAKCVASTSSAARPAPTPMVCSGLRIADETAAADIAKPEGKFANRVLFPSLNILPMTTTPEPDKKTAVQILRELGTQFSIPREYNIESVPCPDNEDGPSSFKATVVAGLREGVGYGGTRMEAMCEAAEVCLRNIRKYNPDFDFSMDFKKWTKTNPAHDILYILARTCKEFGLKEPVYGFETKPDGYSYECHVGEFVKAQGFASKKRVAQRIAAINMYKSIQKVYNATKLHADSGAVNLNSES